MSGGNWDKFHVRYFYEMESFCEDIKGRFPELSERLAKTNEALYEIIHAIDYDVCGDQIIESDENFEKEAISKLNKFDQ
ncbi:MAG: hypothetical protein WD431_14430 [Cyclobacteriaceae bacterium]